MSTNGSEGRGPVVKNLPEYRKAVKALQSGNVALARASVAALGERYSNSVDMLSLLAAIGTAANDYRSALLHINAAERIEPQNAGVLAYKAHTLAMLRDYSAALKIANKVFDLDNRDGEVMATLGSVYTKCGDFGRSGECFQDALQADPNNAVYNYNLGTALRFSGDFEGAERCFNRTLELRPDDFETYYARSGLRTQTRDNNHVAELEDILAKPFENWHEEMFVCYALAKELEDLEEWQQSFKYLKRGADTKRAHMRYDVRTDVSKMEKIKEAFTPSLFESSGDGHPSHAPIFVIGLPRVGSTMVERILSSHDSVISAGELQNFAIELMRPIHGKLGTTQLPFNSIIEQALNLNHAELGRAYCNSAQHIVGQCERFVDKMPMNFLYVGLISLALPNAKIVHVHRDPMDSCYAMYKMLFKGAYPYSYSLDDLADYYAAYRGLMDHWERCLGDKLFGLRYEDIIANQKSATERLLEYCDLSWQEACMSFHKLDAASTTASAVDVRKPIYSSSVGKWQNYRAQLSGMYRRLKKHGVLG